MSAIPEDIDLNSDAVTVDPNNEPYGVNVSESTVRFSISSTETLKEPPNNQGRVEGYSAEGVIDETRVFGGATNSAEAFHGSDENMTHRGVVDGLVVKEGLEREAESVDRRNVMDSGMASVGTRNDAKAVDVSEDEDGRARIEVIGGGKIAAIDGGFGLNTNADVPNTDDALFGNSLCSGKNEGVEDGTGTGTGTESQKGGRNANLRPVDEVPNQEACVVVNLNSVSDGAVRFRTSVASECLHGEAMLDSSRVTEFVDQLPGGIPVMEAKADGIYDSLPRRDVNVGSHVSEVVSSDGLENRAMEVEKQAETDENRIMGVRSDGLENRAMEVEKQAETDENRIMGVHVSEAGVSQHTDNEINVVSLVVDLNSCIGTAGDRKAIAGISNDGSEVKEMRGDVGFSVSDCLGKNVTCRVNGVGLNGNQSIIIEEEATGIVRPKDIEKKIVKSGVSKPESYVNESKAGCFLLPEKEGEFSVSDLVWGKVRSHPWWPGQIFDPLDSSEKAMKYFKEGSYLIAYFGDRTFAWNESSRLKPFRAHFSEMEKQSNSDAFCDALDSALDEISRRVEFGLACFCTPQEVYAKIKSQIIVNAGIREESSRRDGGDKFSSAASFEPVKLVQYLKILAGSLNGGADRLEFAISRAQLLAFCRWKGYSQLPEFNIVGGLLENDDADVSVLGEKKDISEVIVDADPGSNDENPVSSGKGKSNTQDTSSRKRKHISGDSVYPSKKERCLSDLMAGKCSYLSNGENELDVKAGRKLSSSFPGKKRKAVDSISDDSRVKNRKRQLSPGSVNEMSPQPKQSFRVGESIRRVASQLTGSTQILRDGDETSQKNVGKNKSKEKTSRASFCVPPGTSEKSQRRRKAIPVEYLPPDEMLSQLCLAARDPLKGYSFLISIVSFFSDFRNSVCLDPPSSQKQKWSLGKVSGSKTRKKSSNLETTETSGCEGMEDSYWTDRIIQSIPEEQSLLENQNEIGEFLPETPMEKGMPTVEPETALGSSPTLDSKQQTAGGNLAFEAEKTAGHMDEKCKEEYSPTALILNFTDLDSVPSETNLNKIFSRYGPLNESDTEVLKKSSRAKVVFKRRVDAETAFSSAGKFSIFGPSLVSYRLNYSPSPRKASSRETK